MQNQIAFVDDILTSKETAKLIGVDHRTFLNKKQKDEFKGLTAYVIPSTRGYRYIKSEVIAWVQSHPESNQDNTQQTVGYLPPSPAPEPKKKRGRPRGSKNKGYCK